MTYQVRRPREVPLGLVLHERDLEILVFGPKDVKTFFTDSARERKGEGLSRVETIYKKCWSLERYRK